MDRKILVSSIITVAILILVSFNSVIGYQDVKNDVKVSPLFNIRTSRAMGENSKVLTCWYVSKGKTLMFDKRDDRTILIHNLIDNIVKMDDNTFNKFITSIIASAQKEKILNDINSDEIREAFYLFRNNEISLSIFDTDKENKSFTLMPTGGNCYTCYNFCFLKIIITKIIEKIIEFVDWCFHPYTGSMVLTACCNPPQTALKGCPKTLRQLL